MKNPTPAAPAPIPEYRAYLMTRSQTKCGMDHRKLVAWLASLVDEDFAPPIMILIDRVLREAEARGLLDDPAQIRARTLAAAA